MYNGDQARKQALVDFGFRLPSAYDNRPLKFTEFYQHINQVVYVSATPGPWEVEEAEGLVVEQILRPTGLLDPEIEIRPAEGQVDDCLDEIRNHSAQGGRILVTTLTKKLSEDLSKYLLELGVKAKYLHSDIDTIERTQIIQDLRSGTFDVLVGINLLREGLDIPEVSLVVILDADKEGFLRSETSLVQTCGRAARNAEGHVIMYADKMTKAITNTLAITKKRRAIQEAYNKEHGIVPTTVKREITDLVDKALQEAIEKEREAAMASISYTHGKKSKALIAAEKHTGYYTAEEIRQKIDSYEKEMKLAAKEMRFEDAAQARDLMRKWMQLALE
jgi:excinuclease ABC subunit B